MVEAASSLNNIVATVILLRTLIVVTGLFPLVVMASPFVAGLALSVINTLTSGYGFISILGTVTFTLALRSLIAYYAPSPKHRDDAFQKSALVLPVLSFGAFQAILQLLVVPLSSALGYNHLLKMSPSIPYVGALRIAISMFFFGLTIAIRYMGPVSVMCCSAFPVISSPFIAALRAFWTKCTSFDAFVTMIAAPSDTPGVLIDSPFKTKICKGRRYQTPTIMAASLLLCCSLLLAWAAAKVLSYGSATSFHSEIYLNSSWLTVFSHLLMTCFDGRSHELSPARYHRTRLRPLLSRSHLESYLYSGLLSAVMAPLSLHVVTSVGLEDIRWNLMLSSTFVAIFISIYLSFVDVTARNFLCASGFNLQKLIVQVTGEMDPTLVMQVIVKCLLFEDGTLVNSVIKVTSNLGTTPPEEEEISRNKDDSAMMAAVLMTATGDSGLEDDLLRVLILESFGGRDPESMVSLGASLGHEQVVKMLVSAKTTGLVAPVIRALSTYVSGIGLALQDIGNSTKAKQNVASSFEVWALPPGALVCSERALIGLTRCVVHSISSLGPAAMDWRGTELSVFVPVVFIAAFQLRAGIQAYGKDLLVKETKCVVASHLMRLENASDACALFLLKTLQSLESRTLQLTIPLAGCHAWLDALVAQSGTSGVTAPVLIHESDQPLTNSNTRAFDLIYY